MTQFTSSDPAAARAPSRFPVPLLALRIIQFAFSVIVLALVAAAISTDRGTVDYVDDGFGDTFAFTFSIPGEWSYAAFAGAWGILTGLYLIPAATIRSIHTPIATVVLDALNVIFFFTSFIALAAWLGKYDIGDVASVYHASDAQELIAGDVFAALNFLLYVVTLAFEVMGMSRARTTATATTATPMQQMPPTATHTGAVQHEGAIQSHA